MVCLYLSETIFFNFVCKALIFANLIYNLLLFLVVDLDHKHHWWVADYIDSRSSSTTDHAARSATTPAANGAATVKSASSTTATFTNN